MLEYGVQAGLIFCLAREFEPHLNEIIVEKAIRYQRRGVVGIDLAGTERNALELDPAVVGKYRELFAHARKAGLRTTVHTGETAGTGAEGVRAVVEQLEPDRIGHGIRAAQDEKVMGLLKERGVTLEICPTSNLATRAVSGTAEMREVLQKLWRAGVRFTINTDGPYLLDTDMRREVEMLRRDGVLADEQIDQAFRWARESTFVDAARPAPDGRRAAVSRRPGRRPRSREGAPRRPGSGQLRGPRARHPQEQLPGRPPPESRGSSMVSSARATAGRSARPTGAGANGRPSRSLASAVR